MFLSNYSHIYTTITSQMENYITSNKLQSLVIGESGGIDSAVVTVLASIVCKKLSIPLYARYIHIESNKIDEKERAASVGSLFASDFKSIDLTTLYNSALYNMEEVGFYEEDKNLSYRIRLGNIKARLRMVYLYNMASKHRGIVLSTDNWTEYMLGFWTLHGDVGDYGPIQGLWKSEVYGLSQYIIDNVLSSDIEKVALSNCITATPTDGLGTTNSDLEQLKASTYKEVDMLLIDYIINGNRSESLLSHPVIIRHLASNYKRNNPANIERSCFNL